MVYGPPQWVGRRPNTLAPTSFLSVDSEDMARMSKDQLISFAAEKLGRILDPNWAHTKILTAIVNAAVAARDVY